MNIRKATAKDIPGILECYVLLMRQHAHYDILYKSKKNVRQDYALFLKKALITRNALVLVAEESNSIVAFMSCLIEERSSRFLIRKALYIYDIYIKKKCQGQGIGKKFVRTVLVWARKKKIRFIKLEASPLNNEGLHFWKKQGFYIFQYKMARRV